MAGLEAPAAARGVDEGRGRGQCRFRSSRRVLRCRRLRRRRPSPFRPAWMRPVRHTRTCSIAGRRGPLRRCHVLSCSVMRPSGNCHVLSCGAVSAGLCGGGRFRSCVPPFGQRAGRGVPVLRAFRGRARAGVGAGAVRAPDCARETAHAPLALAHAGSFFGPQPVAFRRNAERRPREPPLSTFIIHHTAKCQARPGTKNENEGDYTGGR